MYTLKWHWELKQEDFSGALVSFEKAYQFDDTLTTKYNLWVGKYSIWQFEDAQEIFEELLDINTSEALQFKVYHNLWNTFFQMWMKYFPNEQAIPLFQKSIDMYHQALQMQQDPETLANKQYVEKLLQLLQDSQKQQSSSPQSPTEEQKWEEEKSKSEKNENWEEKSNPQEQENTDSQNDTSQNQWNTQQKEQTFSLKKEQDIPQITPQEKQYMERLMERLEETQKENQLFFWAPKKQERDFFDIFREDPFFSDFWWGWEKDW